MRGYAMKKQTKIQQMDASGGWDRRDFLRATGTAALAASAGGIFAPSIIRAADKPIKIGHLVPQTGFLSAMGEYEIHGASMAVEEVNAAGGCLGRPLELITEDAVNPGIAVQKATKLIKQDKVDALMGIVSSAVCLAVMEVAKRNQILLLNTGANSDEIRGKECNVYTFSVEGCNTQYVNTIGSYLLKTKQYKRWYFLTSDYAFGHDLLRVSRRLLNKMGGEEVGSELIPTGSVDFSSYLLKVKNAQPDVVFQNLAGSDQTNFMKQYNEFGLTIDVAGGVVDTLLVWPVGVGAISGVFPLLWWSDLPYENTRIFTNKFVEKFGKPPENQAWCDYVGIKCIAMAMEEAGTTESEKVVEGMEKIKFRAGKGRELYFRDWDHQLMQPMYVARAKKKGEERDQWDIWQIEAEVPGKDEPLESLAPTREENPCEMKWG
jgi:branched-chain amino acid transport system substrate-binding protein